MRPYILVHVFHHVHESSLWIFFDIVVFLVRNELRRRREAVPVTGSCFCEVESDSGRTYFEFGLCGVYFFSERTFLKSQVLPLIALNFEVESILLEIAGNGGFGDVTNSIKTHDVDSIQNERTAYLTSVGDCSKLKAEIISNAGPAEDEVDGVDIFLGSSCWA